MYVYNKYNTRVGLKIARDYRSSTLIPHFINIRNISESCTSFKREVSTESLLGLLKGKNPTYLHVLHEPVHLRKLNTTAPWGSSLLTKYSVHYKVFEASLSTTKTFHSVVLLEQEGVLCGRWSWLKCFHQSIFWIKICIFFPINLFSQFFVHWFLIFLLFQYKKISILDQMENFSGK